MHLLRTLRHLFDGKRDLTPFFTRQAELLCQCSDTLVRMLADVDPVQWNMLQREIKSCETQGDALLQDFREQLSERVMGSLSRTDLALQELLPLIWHIRDKASAISLLCDRVTEMEHAADDAYEEYIGYIFTEEQDMREMTKYKNLAETLEKATDSQKHVADCVRLMVMRFLHE